MTQSDAAYAARTGADRPAGPRADEDQTVDAPAVLSLLSDEHARELLDLLGRESLSARELAERLDTSRATVYRRLNRLESAGVVESSLQIDPDGHHRKCFHVVVDRLEVALDAEGITVDAAE